MGSLSLVQGPSTQREGSLKWFRTHVAILGTLQAKTRLLYDMI